VLLLSIPTRLKSIRSLSADRDVLFRGKEVLNKGYKFEKLRTPIYVHGATSLQSLSLALCLVKVQLEKLAVDGWEFFHTENDTAPMPPDLSLFPDGWEPPGDEA